MRACVYCHHQLRYDEILACDGCRAEHAAQRPLGAALPLPPPVTYHPLLGAAFTAAELRALIQARARWRACRPDRRNTDAGR